MPEILRKVEDTGWIGVRKNELMLRKTSNTGQKEENAEEVVEEVKEEPYEKVFDLIKKMDKGEGADIEEIISSAKDINAEKIISRLLENGEVFEVKHGKLKVLE